MSKPVKHGAIVLTLLLFIVLFFAGSVLFSSISKDVVIKDFAIQNPEGNIHVQESDSFKTISFRWYYKGLHTISLPISQKDYVEFSSRKRSFSKEYSYYVQDDSSVIDSLAKELLELAAIEKYSDSQTVSFIAAFVQSLKGTPDYFDDYPQFPIETVYLGTGDCEDVAILGTRLLSAAGFDTVLIEIDDHVGVGVAINASGDSYVLNNQTYYYIEMTGTNYVVGELPERYEGFDARLFDPQKDILNPSWTIQKITVANQSIYNISITVETDFTGEIIGYIEYRNTSGDVDLLKINKERSASMILPILPSLDHRLILELRGVSTNTVYLQTAWVTEY